jgi:type IV secretion system protein VirB9
MSARFLILSAAAVAALAMPAYAKERSCVRGASCASELDVLASANGAARQKPSRDAFTQARQMYAYAPGAIYELYANPAFVSSILLEPGETVTAIAAGDTSRWMVTQTEAESESNPRTIVLVKPQAIGLRTNVVIVTDRRTYTVEAASVAGRTYSAEIAWSYPAKAKAGAATKPFDFNYRIRVTHGEQPAWMPSRVYDDGVHTWIEFPASARSSDMPPLFVVTGEGRELVNYRVIGQRYLSIACLIARSFVWA